MDRDGPAECLPEQPLRLLWAETERVVACLQPSAQSNAKRRDTDSFVKDTIRRTFPAGGCCLGSTGSFPLRSYLPESDLDLVIVSGGSSLQGQGQGGQGQGQEAALILAVFNSLCQTVLDADSGRGRDAAFVIRNVEFRNARTKLAHCVVNNLDVDITVNQLNALQSSLLLEEADRAIGGEHLFKRSLLLLKGWCSHESAKYCGVGILGAKDGMFSSYALSVMVLYIFKLDRAHHSELRHPFSVFRYFLKFYSTFQWSR
jgi:DNA polymerase sigma